MKSPFLSLSFCAAAAAAVVVVSLPLLSLSILSLSLSPCASVCLSVCGVFSSGLPPFGVDRKRERDRTTASPLECDDFQIAERNLLLPSTFASFVKEQKKGLKISPSYKTRERKRNTEIKNAY